MKHTDPMDVPDGSFLILGPQLGIRGLAKLLFIIDMEGSVSEPAPQGCCGTDL